MDVHTMRGLRKIKSGRQNWNLWEYDFNSQLLRSGFFVVYSGSDDPVLYEVRNYPLGNWGDQAAVASMVEHALSYPVQSSPLSQSVLIARYSSTEAIARLAQIPVKPRDF